VVVFLEQALVLVRAVEGVRRYLSCSERRGFWSRPTIFAVCIVYTLIAIMGPISLIIMEWSGSTDRRFLLEIYWWIFAAVPVVALCSLATIFSMYSLFSYFSPACLPLVSYLAYLSSGSLTSHLRTFSTLTGSSLFSPQRI
jgi:hypothetical protein